MTLFFWRDHGSVAFLSVWAFALMYTFMFFSVIPHEERFHPSLVMCQWSQMEKNPAMIILKHLYFRGIKWYHLRKSSRYNSALNSQIKYKMRSSLRTHLLIESCLSPLVKKVCWEHIRNPQQRNSFLSDITQRCWSTIMWQFYWIQNLIWLDILLRGFVMTIRITIEANLNDIHGSPAVRHLSIT